MADESRYWMTYRTDRDADNMSGWFGVVDEEAGGIIAYFPTDWQAEAYIEWLKE